MYKSDFEEEQKAKQQLVTEREYLTDQLGKLRDHNQKLLIKINGPNPTSVSQEESNERLVCHNLFSIAIYPLIFNLNLIYNFFTYRLMHSVTHVDYTKCLDNGMVLVSVNLSIKIH